jgi:hypothetical protein
MGIDLPWWASLVASLTLALLRYRVPALPPRLTSAGVGAGLVLFLFAFLPTQPLTLGASLVANGALALALLDTVLSKKKVPPSAENQLADADRSIRRRKIIDGGRQLIADFNAQGYYTHLIQFLETRADWLAIRPHISAKGRQDIENGRMVVLSKGQTKDGKTSILIKEIEALELNWALN